MKEQEFLTESLHIIQDMQSKIYLAKRTNFGWLTVENIPLPSYGITDHGGVAQLFNKLAQYRHAARIFQTRVVSDFNNYQTLLREVEK